MARVGMGAQELSSSSGIRGKFIARLIEGTARASHEIAGRISDAIGSSPEYIFPYLMEDGRIERDQREVGYYDGVERKSKEARGQSHVGQIGTFLLRLREETSLPILLAMRDAISWRIAELERSHAPPRFRILARCWIECGGTINPAGGDIKRISDVEGIQHRTVYNTIKFICDHPVWGLGIRRLHNQGAGGGGRRPKVSSLHAPVPTSEVSSAPSL
jgi:hypothetical protein